MDKQKLHAIHAEIKLEPYCMCRSCTCRICKKPFENWTKNRKDTIKSLRFGAYCKDCYEEINK